MNPPLQDKVPAYVNLAIKIEESPVDVRIRTTSKLARALLMNNQSVGNLNHFIGMRNLGLGVFEVWKAPLSQRETKIFK